MRPETTFAGSLILILLWLVQSALFVFPAAALAKRDHIVYFPNTAYELNIYKIDGKQPGKTLMLIGGIQGNEPGGFLSADLYADMRLEKGSLIVVPRANFYSIITNQRGPHGDMNRKFTHEDSASSMDDKIVAILKKLISESDYLLNLHDGAGFYHPKYIDKWRNPGLFGQSVIADCREYAVPGSDKVIKLGELAEEVIAQVNGEIENDLYKLHFLDTRTGEKSSIHKEQRKSATYYALTRHHIPAFGVETSKFLPSIDLKVRYHNLVINAFMKRFGIIPQSPALALDPPVLKYLVVSINGQIPIVINGKQDLQLMQGDSINVSHIESNYERGLSLDILEYGGLNDYRKDFKILGDTSIIVRKDNHRFAEIPIKVSKMRPEEKPKKDGPERVDYFAIQTKGQRLLVLNGDTLDIVRGDKIKILEVLPVGQSGITVNFKGFVGDKRNNTGEDRGFEIDTAADLMPRYSLNKKEERYEIVASQGETVLGRMIVRIAEPRLDYLILKINDDRPVVVKPEETVSLSEKDKISLEEIRTNSNENNEMHLSVNGHRLRPGESENVGRLALSQKNQVMVKNGSVLLGRVFIDLN